MDFVHTLHSICFYHVIHILWAYAKVFGWSEDSLSGEERESSYSVPVGYLKGAWEAAEDLMFDITVQNGNSGKRTLTFLALSIIYPSLASRMKPTFCSRLCHSRHINCCGLRSQIHRLLICINQRQRIQTSGSRIWYVVWCL